MKSRKETTYGILLLIATVLFVLPCIFLVFPTFDIHRDVLYRDLCFLFTTAAASTHASPISGSDEYRVVGFSEGVIDDDGFPALDDFTLLVRSKKN